MSESRRFELPPSLQPGERAPEFTLPAIHRDGTVSLADYREQAPLLLALFRGLYCPFCRRGIAQLGMTAEKLEALGVETLAVVATQVERARLSALVRQLGADDWRAREKASEELDKIGLAALDTLKAAAKSADAEVAARAERLLAGWRGFLGVEISTAPLGATTAAIVRGVMPGTAAEKAEMEIGDYIAAVDGKEVLTSGQLVERLSGYFAGQQVELTLNRNGEETKLKIELGRRPKNLEVLIEPEP